MKISMTYMFTRAQQSEETLSQLIKLNEKCCFYQTQLIQNGTNLKIIVAGSDSLFVDKKCLVTLVLFYFLTVCLVLNMECYMHKKI